MTRAPAKRRANPAGRTARANGAVGARRGRVANGTTGARRGRVAEGASAPQSLADLQRRVLRWYQTHARAFPWREHRDPYGTLVAEVMLQQTQTGRVGPTYLAFLTRFPTLQRLAHAPAMEVIEAWKGLGYNRRAVNLQRAAHVIEHDHLGILPEDPAVLRLLPGIGDYSANAIACFAFDAQVPVIDVNVARVLGRAALGVDEGDARKGDLERTARAWLPSGEAYRWNQALMDVGALLCRHEQPLCGQCPLRSACAFHAAGKDRVPRPARPPKEPFEGSRRQKRGGIVDALRATAADGLTLSTLAKAVHPQGRDPDLRWLVELLEGLERDGLVTLTPGARRGSPRGLVRLPR